MVCGRRLKTELASAGGWGMRTYGGSGRCGAAWGAPWSGRDGGFHGASHLGGYLN